MNDKIIDRIEKSGLFKNWLQRNDKRCEIAPESIPMALPKTAVMILGIIGRFGNSFGISRILIALSLLILIILYSMVLYNQYKYRSFFQFTIYTFSDFFILLLLITTFVFSIKKKY